MNQFKLTLFDKNNKKHRVSASLDSQGISLEFEGRIQKIIFEHASFVVGGSNNHLIFCEINSMTLTLETTPEMLARFQVVDSQKLTEVLAHRKRYKRNAVGAVVGVIAAVIIVLTGLFTYSDKIVSTVVDYVPLSAEKKIGARLIDLYLPTSERVRNEKILTKLNESLKKLNIVKEQNYHFYISKDSTLNAYALPGGHMVFNLGMLEAADSFDEIVGVAAHELGHTKQRHVLKSIINTFGVGLLVDLIVGDMSGIISVIIQNTSMFTKLHSSREFEREADDIGFDFLVESDIDPRGITRFFERLQEKHENDKKDFEEKMKDTESEKIFKVLENLNEMASTHPGILERIENINNKFEKIPIKKKKQLKKINMNYTEFKKLLKEI